MNEQVRRIRKASRFLARELQVIKAESEKGQLTFSHGHVLLELSERGALTGAELAKVILTNRSSTKRLLDKVQAKGWIRERPGKDRRAKLWELTAAGRRRVKTLDREVDERVTRTLSYLTDNEARLVEQGLRLYAEALRRARLESSRNPPTVG